MADNSILIHWRMPYHRRRNPDADLKGRHVSEVCGDEIEVFLSVRNGTVANAFWDGDGCVVCLGMASLLMQHIIGLSIDEVKALTEADVFRLVPDVTISGSRRDCALVSFRALQASLQVGA
jgi:nitrogen fixation NifU-like protein